MTTKRSIGAPFLGATLLNIAAGEPFSPAQVL